MWVWYAIELNLHFHMYRYRERERHRLTLSIPGPGTQMTLVPGLYSKRFEMSLVKSQSTYQTYSKRIYIYIHIDKVRFLHINTYIHVLLLY